MNINVQNTQKNISTKEKITKILCLFVFLFVLFSVLPGVAQGAELYINSTSTTNGEYGLNQSWETKVFLNSDGEGINAVEGKFLFPSDLLEAKTISDGNSVVNLWVEKPQLESDGQIVFSGITPGGYNGEQGLIFSVIFSSKKEGDGVLGLSQARALLNDGQGTVAPLLISNWQFLISPAFPSPTLPIVEDIYPPEEFLPQITHSTTLFNNQWFLIFATQDKNSGIDRYEVKESKNAKSGRWLVAESPYLLQDQQLKSYIYVKAIDQTGNERIEILQPRTPISDYQNIINIITRNTIALIVLIIVLALIIIGYFTRNLWRKKQRKR
ncbi:MAG: hypothetical protein WC415_01945 [Patescibacteria group bacterium]|jgi:hypothetical protein